MPDMPGAGVFMGYRYKQNGRWHQDFSEGYPEGGQYWHEDARVKVALVVMDAWQEPYTVDPEGLEVVATDSKISTRSQPIDHGGDDPYHLNTGRAG